LVAGPSRDYFWILAREKQLPAKILEQLLEQARDLGIDTGKLIRVAQARDDG
jgi:apolipoprotein D and lipocalin family protein